MYGAGALWKRSSIPAARLISPATVSAPWLVTCASAMKRKTPSRISRIPPQLNGSTEKPKSAITSATAPSAPGSTTPGWKISKPIPAIPARKSSEIRFGSRRVFRTWSKKPIETSSIWAPARCSV